MPNANNLALDTRTIDEKQAIDEAIVNPRTYADENAFHALFTQLRREDPMHWTQPAGFRPFWAVTRHADLAKIELDATKFLNEPRSTLFNIIDEDQVAAFTTEHQLRSLTGMDGSEHRAFRAMTQAWFSAKRITALEQDIRALARESVDDMLARDGRCDFVEDVAIWFPLRVIMSILGVPRSDEQFMMKLTQEMFAPFDPDQQRPESEAAAGATAIIELLGDYTRYFEAVTADRRANPKDDVASLIANATINGQPIDNGGAMGYYIIIAAAGHDTTSSSSAGGLLQLIRNPDQMKKLRDNPALLPGFVDEAIRWVTPVKHFFRTATEDCVINGKEIRAGDSLMMCYWSANRDEAVYPDPFAFRIDRGAPRHLAFGYGPHVCLGQHLAKMEIRILFEELFARVEDIELDGEPELSMSTFVSGLKRMPIRFRPRAA